LKPGTEPHGDPFPRTHAPQGASERNCSALRSIVASVKCFKSRDECQWEWKASRLRGSTNLEHWAADGGRVAPSRIWPQAGANRRGQTDDRTGEKKLLRTEIIAAVQFAEQTPQENNGAVLGPVEVSFVPEEHVFASAPTPAQSAAKKRRTGSRWPLACEGPNTTTSSLGSVGNLGSPFPPSPLFGRAHARTHYIQVPRKASSRTGRGVDLDLHPPSDPIAEFPHDGFRVSAGGAHSSKHHHRRPVVYYILPSTAFN